MAPALLASAAAIFYVYQEEQAAFQRAMREATRAMALVVERELAKRETLVRTLAGSPTLTRGDLAAFHQYAQAMAPANDTVIVLSDLSGQQLLNTRRPFGETALPRTVFAEARRRAGPMATLVSDLYWAPLGKQHSFAVEVPVVRDGRVLYYLSVGGFASHLQPVLGDQNLPERWIGSIIDTRGVIVARSIAPEKIVGRTVPPAMLQALAQQQEGAFRTVSLDGVPVLASFSKSRVYGWGFIIGVPLREITSPLNAAGAFALASLALLAAALAGALWVARQLVGPVRQVAQASEAIGQGGAVEPAGTGLAETDKVMRALAAASRSIRDANEAMQARVADALAEAEKAQRIVVQNQRLEAIGHLTGGVAHDFNNLLMVVSNNVHLLRRQRPELQGSTPLAGIERAVATGTKLTRQLLAFARRQALRPELIRLQDRLPDLMDLVRPTLHGGIEVRCEVDPATPLVRVDPAEFELALINLAVNARDAMEQGGRLSFRARPAPGGLAVIEVADTGKGIEPQVMARVFEPFFTTKPVGHGTGLGLSQVYGFAAQAQGRAEIESEPGRGTVVRLCLPAATTQEAVCDGQEAADPGSSVGDGLLLLVEDNLELAAVTQDMLRQSGYAVRHVASGDEARALLAAGEPFEAVLSDMRMPGRTSGLDLASWLRQQGDQIPIVLMTGYSAELERAGRLQFEVVSKPCPPEQLLAMLRQAVERARAARRQVAAAKEAK
ncbi:candidate histidine kinase, hybrid [Ramlibacter tataouinensis TTB310]|uniref:histidine kinase n=2 Tax=Ramlibacter tataouinensis TaxID=94132 RepID=F5XZE2_RAMTT|nr:candidate histidine kinase, hybrid [Ramlibacter tataouinensis TTB310]